MKVIQTICLVTGLVAFLGLPRTSSAISGCNNAYLTGTYNAQITNGNFQSLINALNGTAGQTGSTGTTGTTSSSGGTTGGATANPGGFGNNPNSISGQTPGLGRFFFDGNGNIVGLMQGANNANITIGTYNVTGDCAATLKLNSGQTFNAILAQGGAKVLFIETDAGGAGTIGELDLAQNACVATGDPMSLAFSFFGAQAVTSTTSTTATAAPSFRGQSAIGTLFLDGMNNFVLTEWVASNGSVKTASSTGTYTLGNDCSIKLKFSSSAAGGTTGSASNLGASFNGLLVTNSSGLISIMPDKSASDTVTAVAFNQ